MRKESLMPTALGPGDPDDGDQGRQLRGLAIAALANIREDKFGYKVPSQSRSGSYLVNLEYGAYCTCPDFEERQQPCKHVYAVQITLEREERADGTAIEAQTIRVQYGQHWPSYNAAQENEGRHFGQLLRSLCDTIPQPPREPRAPGRPALPLTDVVYGLGLKVYAGQSIRRAMSHLRRAEDDGLMGKVPSKSSAIRYLAEPNMTPLPTGVDSAERVAVAGYRDRLRGGLLRLRLDFQQSLVRPQARGDQEEGQVGEAPPNMRGQDQHRHGGRLHGLGVRRCSVLRGVGTHHRRELRDSGSVGGQGISEPQ